jgi:hypothetical protein
VEFRVGCCSRCLLFGQVCVCVCVCLHFPTFHSLSHSLQLVPFQPVPLSFTLARSLTHPRPHAFTHTRNDGDSLADSNAMLNFLTQAVNAAKSEGRKRKGGARGGGGKKSQMSALSSIRLVQTEAHFSELSTGGDPIFVTLTRPPETVLLLLGSTGGEVCAYTRARARAHTHTHTHTHNCGVSAGVHRGRCACVCDRVCMCVHMFGYVCGWVGVRVGVRVPL